MVSLLDAGGIVSDSNWKMGGGVVPHRLPQYVDQVPWPGMTKLCTCAWVAIMIRTNPALLSPVYCCVVQTPNPEYRQDIIPQGFEPRSLSLITLTGTVI